MECRTETYAAYSEAHDMSFILKDTYIGGAIISTEVIGFYYGEPNVEATLANCGSLKADFER